MTDSSRRRRRLVVLSAVVGALAFTAAAAAGVTPTQLSAAGWTCFKDPAAPRISCSDPGHGRPVIGDPDPPPSYNLKVFTLDEEFIGTLHLIRADLYAGQPCPQTGGAYTFFPVLGYYRCEHF